jgi:N-acyl homoserine lactone hydrolase
MAHPTRCLNSAAMIGWLLMTGLAFGVGSSAMRANAQCAHTTRLYVLDGGTLTIADPSGFGVTIEDIKGFSAMPVPAYLVVHPSGTLLWDAGLGDDLVGRPGSETQRGAFGQVVTTTLRGQLADIGYTPDGITYLAMSHLHFDHVGNANDYAGATWIVQKADRDAVDFTDRERTAAYSALEHSETIAIDGDHDVFGDGTVIIKSTPGHTPGHQSLFVNLAETGPVVLSGDLYHYAAERTLSKMPPREVGPGLTAASRASLEAFIAETGSQLWVQHELMQWATLRKAPASYE